MFLRSATARLPSPLFLCGFRVGWALGVAGALVDGCLSSLAGDDVVASHHVVEGGFTLVSWCLVGAGGARVLWVVSCSMGPTVVLWCLRQLVAGIGLLRVGHGLVGLRKLGALGRIVFEATEVGIVEMNAKVCKSLVGRRLVAPIVDGHFE